MPNDEQVLSGLQLITAKYNIPRSIHVIDSQKLEGQFVAKVQANVSNCIYLRKASSNLKYQSRKTRYFSEVFTYFK